MGQIRLNGMKFFAYHGCYCEEQLKGNHFLVDIALNTDMEKASETDNLCDALNYAEVYDLVKTEMTIRSCLLEHLSSRILDRLFENFQQLNWAEVCVAKLNPPIDGQMQSVSVCRQRARDNFARGIVIMILICLFSVEGFSQIDILGKKIDRLDTLNTHSFSIDMDFQFHISNKEMYNYHDFTFLHATRFNYIFKRLDIDLDFSQILEHADDGHFDYTNYVILSSGVFKYRPVGSQKTVVRPLYPEPLLIFQNNTGQGLHWRFQAGVLFHPLKVIYPKLKANLGMGFVYDWSSWEVNNTEKIKAVSSNELREKIEFINSHTKLKNDMYQHHNEFRHMLLLNMSFAASDMLGINFITSYQQSLVSPFSEDVKAEYSELGNIYPYIFSQLSINANINKALALKATVMLDYENNNLSLYNSSWEYRVFFGVVWNFSNQK